MTDIAAADGIEGWLRKADRRLRGLEGSSMKARVPRVCLSAYRPDVTKFQPGTRLWEADTGRSIVANSDSSAWTYADDTTALASTGTTIGSPYDWNTLVARSGLYQVSALGANSPSGAYGNGTLEVLMGPNSSVVQRYTAYSTGYVYTRTRYDTTGWTAWSRFAQASEIPAAAAAPTPTDGTQGIGLNGHTNRNTATTVTKLLGMGTLNVSLLINSNVSGDNPVITLPDGYRPKNYTEGPFFVFSNANGQALGVAHLYISGTSFGTVYFGRMLPVAGGASSTTLASNSVLVGGFQYPTA